MKRYKFPNPNSFDLEEKRLGQRLYARASPLSPEFDIYFVKELNNFYPISKWFFEPKGIQLLGSIRHVIGNLELEQLYLLEIMKSIDIFIYPESKINPANEMEVFKNILAKHVSKRIIIRDENFCGIERRVKNPDFDPLFNKEYLKLNQFIRLRQFAIKKEINRDKNTSISK